MGANRPVAAAVGSVQSRLITDPAGVGHLGYELGASRVGAKLRALPPALAIVRGCACPSPR